MSSSESAGSSSKSNSAEAAGGALAAIVRKTLAAPPAEAASAPAPVADANAAPAEAVSQDAPAAGQEQRGGPRGDRGPRGPRPGGGKGRKPKPAGGDAPGDDGEEADVRWDRSKPKTGVPVPSKRAPLSADLEAELAAALGDLSLDDVVAQGAAAKVGEQLDLDSRHRAMVMKVHGDNVFFSLGGRNEGVASVRSFPDETAPEVGTMIDVAVTGRSRDDGLYDVSVAGGRIISGDWSDIREGSIVEAKVTASNTGGLECQVNTIRGFIPAGQVAMFRVTDFGEYVGQKLVCVVTEANERRGNLVLSRRAVLEREKAAAKEQLLAELAPGQSREGIVRKIMDFGAFVDLGGVDGLLHIAQLSWERIKHPSEVLTEGQKITVRVDKIDQATGKISLGYKSEADHPWKEIEKKFSVGSLVKGTVSRIAEFGAFVKLAPGVEGLIHISELAHRKVYAVANVVKEGDEVEAKVLSLDPQNQRMSLSLKAAIAPPPPKEGEKKQEVEVDEPPRAPAIPKRGGPLKGGKARGSGGDQFGLNW